MVPNLVAYVICGTPRSGSTMLCSLLKSTGIAGRPESYFREPDLAARAARWGIPYGEDFDFAAFVRSAVAAGTTRNGVFGVRVMWGTMEQIVDRLKARYVSCGDTHAVTDLLQRAFDAPVRFLYLHRQDRIGQAVSWARAEQTGYWHPGDRAAATPYFDFEQIASLVDEIGQHNNAWRSWFDQSGIEPYEISYEKLSNDPVGTTRAVLAHLGLSVADSDDIKFDDKRQADKLNAEWIARYRALARHDN